MTKKKKVPLDVFKEAVLPMLKAKHVAQPDALQKAIDDEYEIYREADGKEIPIGFSVSVTKTAPLKTEEEIEAEIEKRAAEKVAAITKANPATVKRIGAVDSKAAANPGGAFVIPATVKFYGDVKNFKREKVGNFDRNERAYRFGMWALACVGFDNAKSFCEENGLAVARFNGTGMGIKLHAEGVNTTGGYLVPEEFSTDLIDLRLQYGVFRRNARTRPMASDTLKVSRRTGGLTAYFTGEGAAGTESTKSWDQVQLVAKDLMVISRMTNQLSEDAVINIGDDLAGEIGYAFALKEDQCGFLGDGTSTYGGIQGVSTLLVTLNGVDDGGGLVLASGNAYSEITLADFNRTVARCPTFARKGAKWYASPNFHDGVMQRLQLAGGGNVVANIAAGGQPAFLGYPVELAEVMPTAEANSQVACLFGDLSQSSSFGDRRQDMIDFSTQASVGGQSLWERNEIGIRGTQRFDIVNHDLGSATLAGPVVGLITAAS